MNRHSTLSEGWEGGKCLRRLRARSIVLKEGFLAAAGNRLDRLLSRNLGA